MDGVCRCLDCTTDPVALAEAATQRRVIATCPTCGGTNITFVGPVPQPPVIYGVSFVNADNTSIVGGTFKNFTGPAIHLDGGTGHDVADNTLINTGGIQINEADFKRLSGNELYATDADVETPKPTPPPRPKMFRKRRPRR